MKISSIRELEKIVDKTLAWKPGNANLFGFRERLINWFFENPSLPIFFIYFFLIIPRKSEKTNAGN